MSDWVRYISTTYQREYWFNEADGVTTWENPFTTNKKARIEEEFKKDENEKEEFKEEFKKDENEKEEFKKDENEKEEVKEENEKVEVVFHLGKKKKDKKDKKDKKKKKNDAKTEDDGC